MLGARVPEENIEIPVSEESWGTGGDLASVRGHLELLPPTSQVCLGFQPFIKELPKLFPKCALPWDKSYQDTVYWPLIGLGGVGLPAVTGCSS